MPGSFTYKISADDLIAARQLHFRKQVRTRGLLALIALLVLLLLLLQLIISPSDLVGELKVPFIGAALAVLGLTWFGPRVLLPWDARRSYRQAERLWTELEAEWDAEGIVIRSDQGHGRFAWSRFHRFSADTRSILLYQDTRIFYLLPARAMAGGEAVRLIETLRQSGLPER